ncbi:aldehyde dehydrogenase family protein [Halothiobacillus sp. 15-55-196]|jgi:hypothetical protein|uniref:aldehyde dehydrogenase family protein n=1 Tax=Halothiobacillus sp. 15-55-196 TaxID=1970382 RepID=UPI0025B8F61F|nr:aldehyde dehydrogenase family protein [Halothiobacillus sp. 15-55-196]
MSFQVINPTTAQPLHSYPFFNATKRDAVISASAAAYTRWRKTSMETRVELLRRVAQIMRAEVESLAIPMVEEMGKPIRACRVSVPNAPVMVVNSARTASRCSSMRNKFGWGGVNPPKSVGDRQMETQGKDNSALFAQGCDNRAQYPDHGRNRTRHDSARMCLARLMDSP